MTDAPFWCKKGETLYKNKWTCYNAEYEEYGAEWQNEMMKHTKTELVQKLKSSYKVAGIYKEQVLSSYR